MALTFHIQPCDFGAKNLLDAQILLMLIVYILAYIPVRIYTFVKYHGNEFMYNTLCVRYGTFLK